MGMSFITDVLNDSERLFNMIRDCVVICQT